MLIRNVHLPHLDKGEAQRIFSIYCEDGQVKSVEPMENGHDVHGPTANTDGEVVDGNGGLLLPSLCHSHIHLDKCFILDQGEPLITGDFSEALKVTSAVKEGFAGKKDDLYARGKRLIEESVANGVTSMRAHVEVDSIVGTACLDVALLLHDEYEAICDVEIAVFMQDSIFDSADNEQLGKNAILFSTVLDTHAHSKAITSVGSAPYVERDRRRRLANIDFVITLAEKHNLHLDFHLDYDLKTCKGVEDGSEEEPLIFPLLSLVGLSRVKSLTLGHMTRLSVFTPSFIARLREHLETMPGALRSISFVGLPQSDLYMMGRRLLLVETRDSSFGAPSAPRGTLNVPRFRRFCDATNTKLRQNNEGPFVNVAMSVNNVANAFTPQGTPDPLSLCPLGVAVYQDATKEGCRILLESITTASKLAIGDTSSSTLDEPLSLLPLPGRLADFVILHDNHDIQSAALSPCFSRTTIKGGKVVARRVGTVQF